MYIPFVCERCGHKSVLNTVHHQLGEDIFATPYGELFTTCTACGGNAFDPFRLVNGQIVPEGSFT